MGAAIRVQTRLSVLASAAGLAAASVTAVLIWAADSPLSVVVDLRPAGFTLGALAALLLCFVLARPSRGAARTTLAGLALAVAVAGSFLFAHRLWFAFSTEEIEFVSGDARLAGTLYLPNGPGPHPGIVLLHGSGRQTRREYLFYGQWYARHGFAALVYDKRGSGRSGGEPAGATYDVLAGDASAAIRYLASRPETDEDRIGLWALSEGGWVAPMVAANNPQTAFIIAVSTTSFSPERQIRYEAGERLRRAGFSQSDVDEALALLDQVSEFQRGLLPRAPLVEALRRAETKPWFASARYIPNVADLGEAHEYGWWRQVMDYDPLPHWRNVDCPVLFLSGAEDLKAPAQLVRREIGEALAQGKGPRYDARIFEGAEHGNLIWRLPVRVLPSFPPDYLRLQVEWARRAVAEK